MTRNSYDRTTPVTAAVLIAAFSLVTLAPVADAQFLGRSARLQGMGSDFVSMVDDPLTDAAFNPARLGSVEGKQVYLAKPTGGYTYLRLPSWEDYYSYDHPTEGYFGSSLRNNSGSSRRIQLTYFTPVAGGMQSSFSVDATSGGYDNARGSSTVEESHRYVSDGIALSENAEARGNESQRFVFAAAVSTSHDPDDPAFGARVSVEYLSSDASFLRQDSDLVWPRTDFSEQVIAYRLYKDSESLEQYGASATLGWFRPAGVIREVSCRAGGLRLSRDLYEVSQEIFDEDADGNGGDPIGVFPVYLFDLNDFESTRDLSGGELSGRVVLNHGDHWRSVHGVGGSILSGDGKAGFSTNDTDRDATTNRRLLQYAEYAYDTEVNRLIASSAVGYTEALIDEVLFAAVLKVVYDRAEFEEDATGTGGLDFVDGIQSVDFESPYDQRIHLIEEHVRAALSVAAEWTLPKYLTFRIGFSFDGERHDYREESRRDVDASGTEFDVFSAWGGSRHNISWDTDVAYRTGMGVRLADRLFVDLYSTSFDFARFYYGTIRFSF